MNLRSLKGFSNASRLEQAALILPLLVQGQRVGAYGWKRWQQYRTPAAHGIKISKKSWFVPYVIEWALAHSNQNPSILKARTERVYNFNTAGGYDYLMQYLVDSAYIINFVVDGRHFAVSMVEEDTDKNSLKKLLMDEDDGDDIGSSYLFVRTNTKEDFEALKEEVEAVHVRAAKSRAKEKGERKNFRVWSGQSNEWGMYERAPRPLDSVILKQDQKEYLVNDLQMFLESGEMYRSLGIPWRRGYLFHGAPGTGKSSIIKALASHFELNLYYMSLADVSSDSQLIKAVSRIDGKGVLLLEDVDVYGSVQDREGDEKNKSNDKGPTLSALLNILDGPATPDGLISFLTTNHRDRLDPALIRNGRIDVSEEISLPDLDQIERLWQLFFAEDLGVTQLPDGLPTAYYYDLFKVNLGLPEKAREGLIAKIEEQKLHPIG